MMKRLAAAVMYAALTFGGGTGTDVPALDSESDAIFDDCSDELASADVLETASRLCGDRIDAAWIGYREQKPSAAVAARFDADQVALVNVTARSSDLSSVEQATALLRAALPRCRAAGALKLKIEVDGLPTLEVRSLAESLGYQFSRAYDSGEANILEFYTNLYWHSKPFPTGPAPAA